MKKVYSYIIFDFKSDVANNKKMINIIDKLTKKNINIIMYNCKKLKYINSYNITCVYDKKDLKKIINLIDGYYLNYVYIYVYSNSDKDIIFIKNNKRISIDTLLKLEFIQEIQSTVISKDIYLYQMAKYIKNAEQRLIKINNTYNKKISKTFKKNYSIYDIFDIITGGVCFKDYEWILLKDSPLKQLFETQIDNSYIYILNSNDSKLLRGCDTYYYLLTYKGKDKNVTLNQINEWSSNCLTFLNKALIAIENFKINDYLNKKLLMALLDNVRGYNYQMLNLYTLSLYNSKCDDTFCIEITENSKYQRINNIIFLTNKLMEKLLFKKISLSNIKQLLNNVISEYKKIIKTINSINSDFYYNKGFKSHREADNFIENYIVCKEYIKNAKKTSIITQLYGGIEIPFLINCIDDRKVKKIYLMSIEGVYYDRHLRSKDKKGKNFYCNFLDSPEQNVVLCDDNILTGRTLNLATVILKQYNINVKEIFVLRHPDINRIVHIWDSKNYVNIDLFNKRIKGALYSCNYSKVNENTNYGNTYLDEFGIFDITKEVICQYIYKNGRFSEHSRVNKYKKNR